MSIDGPSAADAERIGIEFFAHNWLTPEGGQELRAFLMDRYRDEVAVALDKRRQSDRSDVWAEVRRLAEWIGTLDDDLGPRRRSLIRSVDEYRKE